MEFEQMYDKVLEQQLLILNIYFEQKIKDIIKTINPPVIGDITAESLKSYGIEVRKTTNHKFAFGIEEKFEVFQNGKFLDSFTIEIEPINVTN